jgi:hypothetical protein
LPDALEPLLHAAQIPHAVIYYRNHLLTGWKRLSRFINCLSSKALPESADRPASQNPSRVRML